MSRQVPVPVGLAYNSSQNGFLMSKGNISKHNSQKIVKDKNTIIKNNLEEHAQLSLFDNSDLLKKLEKYSPQKQKKSEGVLPDINDVITIKTKSNKIYSDNGSIKSERSYPSYL